MNFLELVQESMKRAGVRSSAPDTLEGVVDVSADFKRYVQDSWRELQEDSLNWWFRQRLDQTLLVLEGVDQYAMPDNLESINYRTCSIYTVPKTNEANLGHMRYEEWRTTKDTVALSPSWPLYIIERPDSVLQVWPTPDQDYTLRYDGVWDIDHMTVDTDEPGSTITGGSRLLPIRHEYVLIYDAARRHHAHHQNEDGVKEMQPLFRAARDKLSERQAPPSYVKPGILTGMSGTYRRLI